MPIAPPQPGMVISYAYLWRGEHEQGREEGAKNHPAVIVLALKDHEGDTIVIVLPITHHAPRDPEDAIEVPTATKARLGLDSESSWAVVSEVNRFVWPGPDLAPVPGDSRRFAYGFLPPRLFKKIASSIIDRARSRKLSEIQR